MGRSYPCCQENIQPRTQGLSGKHFDRSNNIVLFMWGNVMFSRFRVKGYTSMTRNNTVTKYLIGRSYIRTTNLICHS